MVIEKRNLLSIIALVIIVGVILFAVGLKERALASTASQVPEEISLKDLIARGPDGNPNIILKDYVLCDNFVYTAVGPIWSSAWVPVVPLEAAPEGKGGKPAVVQAPIFTTHASNAEDLVRRCGQLRLPAMVTNRISSIRTKEKSLLQESYPRTDFSRCLIIQEGREPAGTLKQMLMIVGGGLIMLIGLAIAGFMGVQWYRDRPAPRRKRRVRKKKDKKNDRALDNEPIPFDDEEKPLRRAEKNRRDDEKEEDRRRLPRRPRRDEEE